MFKKAIPGEPRWRRRIRERLSGTVIGVIFIEQNFGPQMEQRCATFAPSAGSVSWWYASAATGSRRQVELVAPPEDECSQLAISRVSAAVPRQWDVPFEPSPSTWKGS
jgi:hypothetical protein